MIEEAAPTTENAGTPSALEDVAWAALRLAACATKGQVSAMVHISRPGAVLETWSDLIDLTGRDRLSAALTPEEQDKVRSRWSGWSVPKEVDPDPVRNRKKATLLRWWATSARDPCGRPAWVRWLTQQLIAAAPLSARSAPVSRYEATSTPVSRYEATSTPMSERIATQARRQAFWADLLQAAPDMNAAVWERYAQWGVHWPEPGDSAIVATEAATWWHAGLQRLGRAVEETPTAPDPPRDDPAATIHPDDRAALDEIRDNIAGRHSHVKVDALRRAWNRVTHDQGWGRDWCASRPSQRPSWSIPRPSPFHGAMLAGTQPFFEGHLRAAWRANPPPLAQMSRQDPAVPDWPEDWEAWARTTWPQWHPPGGWDARAPVALFEGNGRPVITEANRDGTWRALDRLWEGFESALAAQNWNPASSSMPSGVIAAWATWSRRVHGWDVTRTDDPVLVTTATLVTWWSTMAMLHAAFMQSMPDMQMFHHAYRIHERHAPRRNRGYHDYGSYLDAVRLPLLAAVDTALMNIGNMHPSMADAAARLRDLPASPLRDRFIQRWSRWMGVHPQILFTPAFMRKPTSEGLTRAAVAFKASTLAVAATPAGVAWSRPTLARPRP